MHLLRPISGWPLVLGGLLGVVVAGCDSFTDLGGRVVDEAGRLVPDAAVVARKGEARTVVRSDSIGRFELGFTGGFRSPDVVLSACLSSYRSRPLRFKDGAQARELTITLLPIASVPPKHVSASDTLPCG
jgi:hypothetical protein